MIPRQCDHPSSPPGDVCQLLKTFFIFTIWGRRVLGIPWIEARDASGTQDSPTIKNYSAQNIKQLRNWIDPHENGTPQGQLLCRCNNGLASIKFAIGDTVCQRKRKKAAVSLAISGSILPVLLQF